MRRSELSANHYPDTLPHFGLPSTALSFRSTRFPARIEPADGMGDRLGLQGLHRREHHQEDGGLLHVGLPLAVWIPSQVIPLCKSWEGATIRGLAGVEPKPRGFMVR